ncbi:MAG TPA: protein kinase [Polyangiaceae bacterium]|nr:protein kinase [Polyangiaceae bacterium]
MSDQQSSKKVLDGGASRFRVIREVSRGGIGRIDAALDPIIGRKVAIKTLREELKDEEQVALLFGNEAQITGQLEHPNVVPIYDLGEDENGQFIVMKLVKGQCLADVIKDEAAHADQPAALQRLIQIVLRLCDALSYAHSRGVIHCDVKPDNVMVGDHGQVYLMDWGAALLLAQQQHRRDEGAASIHDSQERVVPSWRDASDSFIHLSTTGGESNSLNGTPAYMAPEQLLGQNENVDPRTDVFGLGAVLYEILTGDPPNDRRRLLGHGIHTPLATPTQSKLWPQLPPGLCRISLKALSPQREDRYQTIGELRADLEQFLSGGGWFETQIFEPGASIVTEGEPGDAAYIIESGSCEVFKLIEGKQVLVRRLDPGDVFGETAVFTGSPRTASVIARERVTLKVITGPSLNRELDHNPWLATFVRSLAELFKEADARLSRNPDSYE